MRKIVSDIGLDKIQGSLMGGAIGDAIGYAVEFMPLADIIKKYGINGIADMPPEGIISDDTQMTLFTAEGMLRAWTRGMNKGICHIPTVVYYSYLRWLHTQNQSISDEFILNGKLIENEELFSREAPGNTCISALSSKVMGLIEKPINNSKGCGGVMRAAPIGFFSGISPFDIAGECAAITHGHPTGYLAAAAFAQIIWDICHDWSLYDAINHAIDLLTEHDKSDETIDAIRKAVSLSKEKPSRGNISRLGRGWIAEEALGIALYCALCYQNDFEKAILMAVNHDGDSDSTASICGNIMGAKLGLAAIRGDWIDGIKIKDIIFDIAKDIHTQYVFEDYWNMKYPEC